ncbi:XRE family transcriptional regulator [Methylosinus sporium]|uniref:XRE family transcriptional regulator n=1 Tax=Methylosinus sporium TaxID=428 RepID=UPI00383A346F
MANHERIELVRRRLGLTKIGFAELLGVDRKTLQRFEGGTTLSDDVLNRLCEVSGFGKAFFERPVKDAPNAGAVSFRSQRSLTASARDAALAAAVLAFEIDDWIQERFELPEPSLPQVTNKSPIEAAAALRAYWGIGEKPIANMINVLETHGVRVFSLVEETRHLDAYSFWRNDRPYVFLNTLKTAEHSRFDAAHELGHLVMHRHGGPTHRNAEDEANAFASAFLIPPADLCSRIPYVRSLNDIIEAKRRWRVSAAALNYALHRSGLISDWIYRGNYIQLNKMGHTEEPNGIERETSQIWQKILMSLWSDGISISHIASELLIPQKEISNLLFGIAAPLQDGGVRRGERPRLV